ncbi:MAG: hypothetical protein CME26_09145 [Gemmatimonadetes bacterium]|nr:hypothetical protein [Gemmatimonadota bacterium]|tara:strand:- start:219 stop:482 length:264 start_codon:yes stop_codon:yes gene_type:complete
MDPQGDVLWSFQAAGPIESAPPVAAGRVFVDGGKRVYALNAETGSILWQTPTRGGVMTTPTVADQTVFVSDGWTGLIAADWGTGVAR